MTTMIFAIILLLLATALAHIATPIGRVAIPTTRMERALYGALSLGFYAASITLGNIS